MSYNLTNVYIVVQKIKYNHLKAQYCFLMTHGCVFVPPGSVPSLHHQSLLGKASQHQLVNLQPLFQAQAQANPAALSPAVRSC